MRSLRNAIAKGQLNGESSGRTKFDESVFIVFFSLSVMILNHACRA